MLYRSPLLTDLYQLTMLQSYFEGGMTKPAVFEFFVRRLPPQRNFLVAAGLEQVLEYLEELSFSPDDLRALQDTELFSEAFLDYLAKFRFEGEVEALPEGTLFFANEPVLRVIAPLPQAQFVESRLINILHFQTLIASKAARYVLTAPDKQLVDFGLRRAHGAEASLYAARASFLAGFDGTATVLARQLFGIPIFGTMAHSYIQAHDSEAAAFEHFARSHRGAIVLLIDTYDTAMGARRVVEIAPRLAADGIRIAAVRLDSGDLAALAREVREILDQGGCESVQIFASGGIDEHQLAQLVADRAPIDGFGLGTDLDVSADAPALDCVYKIQEYDGRPRRKRSAGKATLPGRKQIYRHYDAAGLLEHDVLGLDGESRPGEALLEPVMRAGRRLAPPPSLQAIRARVREEFGRLRPEMRVLRESVQYPVKISPALEALTRAVDTELG